MWRRDQLRHSMQDPLCYNGSLGAWSIQRTVTKQERKIFTHRSSTHQHFKIKDNSKNSDKAHMVNHVIDRVLDKTLNHIFFLKDGKH